MHQVLFQIALRRTVEARRRYKLRGRPEVSILDDACGLFKRGLRHELHY
jgi:hypothetical protein